MNLQKWVILQRTMEIKTEMLIIQNLQKGLNGGYLPSM